MTVRVGVIGCGTVARRMHIPALASIADVEIVACASRSRSSAEAAAAEAAGAEVIDDWRDLVISDRIDAVDICSPNAFHAEQAVAAATAGKHVLVEKPIASTLDGADEMLAAAAGAGVTLHVTQNLRYLAPVLAAREVIASGRLGEIAGLRTAFGHSGPQGWAPGAKWFFDAEQSGGGALIDLGIHIVDLVLLVSGLGAVEVSAMTQTGDRGVEDAAMLVVRFATGVVGTIHASWVSRPAPDMSLTVLGTEGTLHFDVRTPLTLRKSSGEKEQVELPGVEATPYSDFVRAVRGSEPLGPAATGADGRAALAVVAAAYSSASSGKVVEVAR